MSVKHQAHSYSTVIGSGNDTPKYYRFTLYANDRITGSSFAEPLFVLNLPKNRVNDNINARIRIIPDYIHITAKTVAGLDQDSIEVRFKNIGADNQWVSTGAGNGSYMPDTCLARIHFDQNKSGLTNPAYSYVMESSRDYGGRKGFVCQASAFNMGQVQFRLQFLDGTAITAPDGAGGSVFTNYVISLGVYYDED